MAGINGARQRACEMYPRRGLTEIYELLKMHAFATAMQLRPLRARAHCLRMNSREVRRRNAKRLASVYFQTLRRGVRARPDRLR